MTDGDILCNFKKCRKVLSGFAYITRCSHAFCEEDGIREIESVSFDKKCPACRSSLTKSYDLVKVNLNPTDQFRAMVLAGLRPEVVMDITTRAIMFWTYQHHQEHLHQEMVARNLRDIINQMKTESQVEIGAMKSDLQAQRRKIEALEKELGEQRTRNQEISEQLTLRTRTAQKWQMECESLKRKQLEPMVLSQEVAPNYSNNNSKPAKSLGPQTMDEFTNYDTVRCKSPGPNRSRTGFVFEPRRPHNYASPTRVFFDNMPTGQYGKM